MPSAVVPVNVTSDGAASVPLGVPRRIATLAVSHGVAVPRFEPQSATAMSARPSLLKSPMAMLSGAAPTATSPRTVAVDVTGAVTGRKRVLEGPPLGAGLTTEIAAVPAAATDAAGIVALSCPALTKLV